MRVARVAAVAVLLGLSLPACASSSSGDAQPVQPNCAEEIDPNSLTIDAAICQGTAAVAWFFESSTPPQAVAFLIYRRDGVEPRPWEMQNANSIAALTVFRDFEPDDFATRNLFSEIILYGKVSPEIADELCAGAVLLAQRAIAELDGLRDALCDRVDPYAPEDTIPPISDTGTANAVELLVSGFSFGAQVALDDRYLQLASPELVAAMDAGHPWVVDVASCTVEGCVIRGSNGTVYFVGVRDDGYITSIEQR